MFDFLYKKRNQYYLNIIKDYYNIKNNYFVKEWIEPEYTVQFCYCDSINLYIVIQYNSNDIVIYKDNQWQIDFIKQNKKILKQLQQYVKKILNYMELYNTYDNYQINLKRDIHYCNNEITKLIKNIK